VAHDGIVVARRHPRRHESRPPVLPSSLTVSIVTYRTDAALLERCLAHLALAIRSAREEVLTQVTLALTTKRGRVSRSK
jgi:hypothetical protein